MATISENLLALNETKQAIKTAIENKGQDLTGVPFTDYANKISEIASGGKKFNMGTVTFATAQAKQTVTHNLGVIPSCVMLYPKDLSVIPASGTEEAKGGSYKFLLCRETKGEIFVGFSFQGNTSSGAFTWQVNSNIFPSVNETIFTTGAINNNYKFPANIEFEWIAIE